MPYGKSELHRVSGAAYEDLISGFPCPGRNLKSACLNLKRGDSNSNSAKLQARILALHQRTNQTCKSLCMQGMKRCKSSCIKPSRPHESCKSLCMKSGARAKDARIFAWALWFCNKMPELLHRPAGETGDFGVRQLDAALVCGSLAPRCCGTSTHKAHHSCRETKAP
jgi:hypothetical protein